MNSVVEILNQFQVNFIGASQEDNTYPIVELYGKTQSQFENLKEFLLTEHLKFIAAGDFVDANDRATKASKFFRSRVFFYIVPDSLDKFGPITDWLDPKAFFNEHLAEFSRDQLIGAIAAGPPDAGHRNFLFDLVEFQEKQRQTSVLLEICGIDYLLVQLQKYFEADGFPEVNLFVQDTFSAIAKLSVPPNVVAVDYIRTRLIPLLRGKFPFEFLNFEGKYIESLTTFKLHHQIQVSPSKLFKNTLTGAARSVAALEEPEFPSSKRHSPTIKTEEVSSATDRSNRARRSLFADSTSTSDPDSDSTAHPSSEFEA